MAHSASTSPVSGQPVGGHEPSIGALAQSAMADVSTLIRSEIELAKTEVASSAKKAAIGGAAFAAAGVIVAFSFFFLVIAVAEFLTWLGLERWISYLVVWVGLLLIAGIIALVGRRFLKKIEKPERTIETLKDLPELARREAPGRREHDLPTVSDGHVVKADPHARLR
ncbi:phage holin family protein [Modestobacter sp. I12A-02628]|uniref:Phage holin family protein n=1 Tax=Goekera deserti TaxID=2497753 RepID=A0A7K3WEJ0_9ACTN|nr:phage holin family protein [Goekera deserti]MPQ98056.1 phage holin family protein [Goekera deserti]NDI48703.1 phage holin family protein [Goekera deserti]NEL54918.1 phage holin family protein [Goekera deserti]